MRRHRVGTVTLGMILVLSGALFLSHLVLPALSYEMVFRFWPLILIFLGAETLYCNKKYEDFHYDFGAVCMALLVGFLAVCMAYAELGLEWAVRI